ncbi:uncharacterized protein LOC144359255 [Saccoglossus kowalevskii]
MGLISNRMGPKIIMISKMAPCYSIFSYTIQRVQAKADTIWKFYLYKLILEYHKKPAFPPPLIAFNHVYKIVRHYYHKNNKKSEKKKLNNDQESQKKINDLEHLYRWRISHCLRVYLKGSSYEGHLNYFERKHARSYFRKQQRSEKTYMDKRMDIFLENLNTKIANKIEQIELNRYNPIFDQTL